MPFSESTQGVVVVIKTPQGNLILITPSCREKRESRKGFGEGWALQGSSSVWRSATGRSEKPACSSPTPATPSRRYAGWVLIRVNWAVNGISIYFVVIIVEFLGGRIMCRQCSTTSARTWWRTGARWTLGCGTLQVRPSCWSQEHDVHTARCISVAKSYALLHALDPNWDTCAHTDTHKNPHNIPLFKIESQRQSKKVLFLLDIRQKFSEGHEHFTALWFSSQTNYNSHLHLLCPKEFEPHHQRAIRYPKFRIYKF